MPFEGKQPLQAGYLGFDVSVRLQQEALSRTGTDPTCQEIPGDVVAQSQGWLQEQMFSCAGQAQAWQGPVGGERERGWGRCRQCPPGAVQVQAMPTQGCGSEVLGAAHLEELVPPSPR